MKMWIEDSFGKPGYNYDRYEVVNGRRKKISNFSEEFDAIIKEME